MDTWGIITNIKSILIAAGSAIIGIVYWLMKRKLKNQEETINRQETAIDVYKEDHEIHKEDNKIDSETSKEIEEIKDKVSDAPTEKEAAEVVSDSLNDFFGGDKDKKEEQVVKPKRKYTKKKKVEPDETT
jgi:hypothetical protein